jgi:hypothetical protein
MNYLLISDYLWYFGHIFSGLSVIFNRDNYYIAATLIIFGQFITIISRPIGRIKSITYAKIETQTEKKHNEIIYHI